MNGKIFNLLLDLGLTEYEARTVNTLFKFIEADAPLISRNAEIPKTRIYDVLEKLKSKGIVLEVYGRPKKYKIIDPKEVFKNLFDIKRKELDVINRNIENVLVKENWSNHIVAEEKILQVKNLNDYNKLLSQELQSADKEIIGFTHFDERLDALKETFSNEDLNIKLITKPLTKQFDFPKNVQVQEREHSMDAFVVDKNKVIMSLNNLTVPKKTYHFTVLQNNPSLTSAIVTHFDDYWKKK
jgi:HTH-type transcriptional regulator, sugar sensing transcriptional regulator